MKKHGDGILLKNLDPMRKLMPYIFKTRNGSIIYAPLDIEFETAKQFINNLNKTSETLNISTFELVIAALVRTYAKYPYLNRYILNKKLYARKTFSLSFVVLKKEKHQLKESIAKVYFNLDDDLFQVSNKIKLAIEQCELENDKEDDHLMNFVSKLPSFILNTLIFLVQRLSHTSLVPQYLYDLIPLYSSVFISNLGSIGLDAHHHHLYDWGTTSIFVTMGKYKLVDNKQHLPFTFSIDERIADGYYFGNSIKYFTRLLQHPNQLVSPPQEIIRDDGI